MPFPVSKVTAPSPPGPEAPQKTADPPNPALPYKLMFPDFEVASFTSRLALAEETIIFDPNSRYKLVLLIPGFSMTWALTILLNKSKVKNK